MQSTPSCKCTNLMHFKAWTKLMCIILEFSDCVLSRCTFSLFPDANPTWCASNQHIVGTHCILKLLSQLIFAVFSLLLHCKLRFLLLLKRHARLLVLHLIEIQSLNFVMFSFKFSSTQISIVRFLFCYFSFE